MIIYKYLAKEVYGTLLAVTLVLLCIFMGNRIIYFLNIIAAGKLAPGVLVQLILLQIPYLLAMLLPGGLFFGILLAYGRLYVDHEMTVLSACGVSRAQLVKMTLGLALVVAVLVGMLMIWLNPYIAKEKDEILYNQEYKSVLSTIVPGRFQATKGGSRVFYVENMSKDRKDMQNIFMAQAPTKKNADWVVLSAKGGYQWTKPKGGGQYVVATDGYRYEGKPGQKDYQITQFGKYGVLTGQESIKGLANDRSAMSTMKLIRAGFSDPQDVAELQWRLAMPISVILLSLLAIPLSRSKPRQGRFAQLMPAVLIYILYVNLMFLGRAWIESGATPMLLGVWWVHGIIGLIILGLYGSQGGWLKWWRLRRGVA